MVAFSPRVGGGGKEVEVLGGGPKKEEKLIIVDSDLARGVESWRQNGTRHS